MNITLLLMLAVPILGAAIFYQFLPKQVNIPAAIAALVIGLIVVGISFGVSYAGAVDDVEILNGKVISKDRVHGEYEESYKCHCRTVYKSSGFGKDRRTWTEEECDTCYRTHYTVHWNCNTTLGGYTIDSLDRLSRSVYDSPDPARWLSIQPNDPVARTHTYTNYVQAVSNSLFAASDENLMKGFAPLLTDYPANVYDIYRIDRFISPGFAFTDAAQWNADISKMLIDLGGAKQVNAVVVVAKTSDRSYVSALRTKWEGANKNDVVLVIGSLDGQKIEFVDVITWSKNEIFKVELIDRVQTLGIVSRPQIIGLLQSQIAKNFERRHMREFEYLKGEIAPSDTTITFVMLFLVVSYGIGFMFASGQLDHLFASRRRF